MDQVDSTNFYFNQSTEGQALISFENNFTINYSNESILSIHLNDTYMYYNDSNATSLIPDWRDAYKPIMDLLMLLCLILIMLAMGCDIKWKHLLHHLKKPTSLCIGILSQFGIMPLSAFCILLITDIQDLHATGVLITSCCPGGALSNTFTYFCDGNLPLSVAMTCASTAMAVGMMPLNLWLYGRHFESEDLVIPYQKIAMSLVFVTSPVLVGMLMKWKLPRVAKFTTKYGSYGAFILILVFYGIQTSMFPNMFESVPFKLYVIILSLPAIGMTLGYSLAKLLKQDKTIRKTIAIECGIQNVPIAISIIALSFSLEMQEYLVILPMIYSFAMMSSCTVICLTYHVWKKCFKKTPVDTQNGIAMKEDVQQKIFDPFLGDTENADHMNVNKITKRPSVMKNEKQDLNNDSYV